jgi:glutamate/tyrosine decarboxylase-like PLP-dependent enzyme
VDRIYLQHEHQGKSKAPDYRHWQIQLGRRFRSLKVWMTLRTMGADKIRDTLRYHISLANKFVDYVNSDARFEMINPPSLALVCFRLKGEDHLSQKLLKNITDRKKIFMIPATSKGKFIIRFNISGFDPKESDIDYAWEEIRTQTDIVLEEHRKATEVIIQQEQIVEKEQPIGKITESFADMKLSLEKAQ